MNKQFKTSSVIVLLNLFVLGTGGAVKPVQAQPEPSQALFRSVLLPGWGHYYVDKSNWARGQAHLASDVILIVSFFGLNIRAENLESQYQTLARLNAGVELRSRNRSFLLAVGDFANLDAYNDYQLRSRSWNRILEDRPENRWDWESAEKRREYRNLRSKVDRTEQRIPAIVSLLIVNRVVSGISAWMRAREKNDLPELTFLPARTSYGSGGFVARISIPL